MGGIGDFLDSVGHVIGAAQDFADKVNKWTLPSGIEEKPLFDFRGDQGPKATSPFETFAPKPEQINPGIEHTMSGMRWLYDNGISQPIATAALVGKMNRGKNSFFGGDYFNSGAWSRSWSAANHISLGQAFVLNPEEAQRAIDSPLLYYKPPEAYLPPGFDKLDEKTQQQALKEAGMPATGNAYIEGKRDRSAWFKYGTGAIDFSAIMFLDPTTLALGAVGKVAHNLNTAKAGKAGFSAEQIDAVMGHHKMQTMADFLWRNKDNPQLVYNTELAQRSGMGPAKFAKINSLLQSPDELNLFIRIGMGDGKAIEDLGAQNAAIKARMVNTWSRLDALGKMHSSYAAFPNIQALVGARMAQVAQGLQADSDLMLRYTDLLANQGLLDQLHLSRWGIQRAEDRTIAQNQYRAGPARGVVSGLVRGQSRAVTIRPTAGPLTTASYTPRVVDSGIVHTRMWGAGDFFQTPVTLIRSVKNMNPRGFIDIGTVDRDGINELRGHLARIPGIKESTRQNIVNSYMKTATEHERKSILEEVGRLGAAKVAQRYGLNADTGVQLWREHVARQEGEITKMRERYTGGMDPERTNATGQPMHLDELPTTGGKVVLTPFTASRLMNGHTFQDLDALQTVLARHGNRLETLRRGAGGTRDWIETGAEYTTFLWKFTTLFRLGYIPRVLGDDLASQWASAGTAAMAIRAMRGTKNWFENGARWIARPALQAREDNARFGAQYALGEAKIIRPQAQRLRGQLAAEQAQRVTDLRVAMRRHAVAQQRLAGLNPADLSPRAMAVRQFASQRASHLRQAQARASAPPSPGKTQALFDMQQRHDMLMRYHDLSTRAADDYLAKQQKVIQGSEAVDVDGFQWPAAFAGRSGKYALDQISADQSVGNLFARNKQIIQGNLERSFNHGGQSFSAAQDPVGHLKAWTHAINNVIMQDPLSKMAVKGSTIKEMTEWLQRNPLGQAYRARMPKMIHESEFARSAKYEVDQYMHTPEIRQRALENPDGVDEGFLKAAVPKDFDRPDVHTGQLGLSQLSHMNALDRVIAKWYRVAATIPADRMSRHPLFNQFYEGHVKRLSEQFKRQGYEPNRMTVEQTEQLAHNARQLALRDTRSLVFDIAHRSDAAAALRFMSPFFSATTEAFQRWGRVLADKPQITGYAANWYNAPAYMGAMQDQDGNKIDDQGYTYLPQWQTKADGSPDYSKKPKLIKRLVPKSERYIVTRMPKWVVDSPLGAALNIRESNGQLMLSQNSIDMVTQGDPWMSPGLGPIVQIPVNEYVRDKPTDGWLNAEVARRAGILPFGVVQGGAYGENPLGRSLNILSPVVLKNALSATDTSDDRYQRIKLQIMNKAIYEHDKLGKPMPSAQDIADRVRNYWAFQAMASFVQPFATQRKDPYQFYYDQYHALRNQNPMTADDEFLKRFEESQFVFASEISKSQGIPPTTAALDAVKKYGKFIEKNPDLAPLLIGPEGKGPFSLEAYQYELNNPLVPGGAEMMRTKISADEAVKENQKRMGWAKYTKRMNTLNADLRKAGFTSFEDDGAEDFKAQKQSWTQVYANPLLPDGTPNPYYNAAWADDFNTYNPKKYDALIPALMDIAASPLANDPQRTDIKQLKQYLGGRLALVRQLNELKQADEPSTLNAAANADLRYEWAHFVDGLIEQSPRFGDLYHRYLSRDMGVDAETEASQ